MKGMKPLSPNCREHRTDPTQPPTPCPSCKPHLRLAHPEAS
jgi:hypothetical protein